MLLGRGIVPVMQDVVLNLTFGISSPFNKDQTRTIFLILKFNIVLETSFFRIDAPSCCPGHIASSSTSHQQKSRKGNKNGSS